VWWYTIVIPALGKLRQEDGDLVSLGYNRKTLSQKKKI
jgi:hypothetical protein